MTAGKLRSGDLSEHKEKKNQEQIRKEADGCVVVRGDLPIREANRLLDLDLREGDTWSTVAGLVVALAGGIPQRGARVRAGNVELEVVDASARRVREVRVRR